MKLLTFGENITIGMSFALMLKDDVLGTSPNERHFGIFVFRTFLQKSKTIKQIALWYFRHTFGEIKLKTTQ